MLIACGSNSEGSDTATAADSPVELNATAGTYELDKTHASLSWSLTHLGMSDYTARFASLDATVVLDPENLGNSSVSLVIDPASVRTNYPLDYKGNRPTSAYDSWDDEIATNEGMLGATDGSEITFTSTSVEQTGPRTANVIGNLTMRGQTKPVTMGATFTGDLEEHPFAKVPAIGFSAEGSFKPSDFGVNLMGGVLGDEVTVRFSGEFQRTPDTEEAASE